MMTLALVCAVGTAVLCFSMLCWCAHDHNNQKKRADRAEWRLNRLAMVEQAQAEAEFERDPAGRDEGRERPRSRYDAIRDAYIYGGGITKIHCDPPGPTPTEWELIRDQCALCDKQLELIDRAGVLAHIDLSHDNPTHDEIMGIFGRLLGCRAQRLRKHFRAGVETAPKEKGK